ncbi:PLP-dependent transferase [Aspergillus pseudotamarii]|uniref:PLP-dependent transferase n=1 Tax=Aspergillus pseudotamarii TaxID=132259 RepID=A0A5N6TBN7_ASPPS|nr:PLP-dependent transferase [Aspergillus pseudotamarii]KAE8143589.1 PLP-dependent transferase [Aspergillus pseudotamarii]
MLVSQKQINFLRGWPTPGLLPTKLLSSACQRVLANPNEYTEMQEYGSCQGLTRLRKGLANWVGRHYGVSSDLERICITGGASQNLVCILQCFSDVNYTRAVWIVAPCYHLACGIFEDSGFAGRLYAVPEDDEGIDLQTFDRRLQEFEKQDKQKRSQKPFKLPSADRKLYRHLIYTVPTCSNPSGVTMSLGRREGLVQLARKYDALVISDDVYDFLQWPLTEPVTPDRSAAMRLPRLCDIDRSMGPSDNDPHGFGHAVSNASFSKISGPSVRTGWAEASPMFISRIARTAATRSGGAPSQLCAAMLAEVVENGQLQRFLDETVRPTLQRRHGLMMDAVQRHLSPLGVKTRVSSLNGQEIYGGYFVWLDMGSEFSTRFIADVLKAEENIVIGHGQMFAVYGDEKSASFDSSARLCFAWEAEQDIVDGIRRMGQLLSRMHSNREHYLHLASMSGNMG